MNSLTHLERDKFYHNKVAKEYDKIVVQPRQYTNNLLYSLINKKIKKKYNYGLDLGCGTGHMSLRFGRRVKLMDAVDSSKEMIRIAEKKLSKLTNIRFFVNDYKDFFQHNQRKYQIIFCTGFIHHLLAEERENLLKTLYPSLESGGILLLSEPIKIEEIVPKEIKLWNERAGKKLAEYSIDISEPDEAPLDKKMFLRLLKKCGFSVDYLIQSWEIFPCHVSYIYNFLKIRQYFYKYLGGGNVLTAIISK